MASIRQHGVTWQARVSRKGFKTEVRSFTSRQDAVRWARSVEAKIDQGSYVSQTTAQRTTLHEVIDRYVREVLPSMKGEKDDSIRLKAIQQRWISNLNMVGLTPEQVAKYRDERLRDVASSTVIRELAYLSAIINHARREWGIHIENPVASVKKPPPPYRASTSPLDRSGGHATAVFGAEGATQHLDEALGPYGDGNCDAAGRVAGATLGERQPGETHRLLAHDQEWRKSDSSTFQSGL